MSELLQGTLDLLILRTLLPGRSHGHAIAKHIRRTSEDLLQVESGSLYPALHRLEAKGVDDKQAPCLPLETSPRNPLVRRFLESVGQRHPAGVHYFCDAAVLAEGGIPSIAFGPGDIAQAHTANEWISLDSLERGREGSGNS